MPNKQNQSFDSFQKQFYYPNTQQVQIPFYFILVFSQFLNKPIQKKKNKHQKILIDRAAQQKVISKANKINTKITITHITKFPTHTIKAMQKPINFTYQPPTTLPLSHPTLTTKASQPQQPSLNPRNSMDMKKIVQNYEFWLGDILSKNLHSTIYVGTDKNTHEKTAIKVIPIEKAITARQRHEIQNQIKYCKLLGRHRSLVKVMDTFSTSNNFYVMMERAEGDLKQLLMRRKVMQEEEVIGVMVDLLEGLRFMWQAGLQHCNLKPSNVLLCADGAKLTDFALTRKIGQQTKSSAFQPAEWTPYMNHLTLVTRQYDPNNDAWALGVLVYECLHGYHTYPWKFQSYSDLLQQILDPKPLPITNKKVSKEMCDFLNRVLNPKSNVGVMELFDDVFVRRCVEKRRGEGLRQVGNFNDVMPIQHQSKGLQRQNTYTESSNKCPQQITQLTSPHLLHMKRHTSNYQTTSSPTTNPHNVPSPHSPHPKESIDCQLSFMRFINIILKQDEHGYQPEKPSPNNTTDPKVLEILQKKDLDHKLFRFVLIKQMLTQKECLKQTVDLYAKENPFAISGMEEYLQTPEGRDTARVVKARLKEYDEKYAGLEKEMLGLLEELAGRLNSTKPEWRSRDILTPCLQRKQILPILGVRLSRQLCKLTWYQLSSGYTLLSDPKTQQNESQKQQIITQMQEKARRVDFLMTYYMLNCLLIDNFGDEGYFVRNSGLGVVMNNKPMKMELEHFRLVEEKLRVLEIV